MPQHDYNLSNQSFPAFRADTNSALVALATNNSGPLEPSTPYAFMRWADQDTGLWKVRNSSNTAWVTIGPIDQTAYGLAPLASPQFTGTPTAPTAAAGTSTVQLATTAFVATAVAPVAAAVALAAPVLGTVQSSTSGTAINFTGIPSYAKRVTLLFNGVSQSSANDILVQLGVGTTPTTSGYTQSQSVLVFTGGGTTVVTSSAGIPVTNFLPAYIISGRLVIERFDPSGNTWLATGHFTTTAGAIGAITSAGVVSLSGALGMVRVTTAAGTAAFDLGSMNIIVE
jgi:hypothetical protein